MRFTAVEAFSLSVKKGYADAKRGVGGWSDQNRAMLTAHATAHTAQRQLAAQRLQHAMPSPSWLTTWPNTDPLLSLRRLASTSSSTFMQVTKYGESAPEAPWHPPIGDRAARGAWSALLRCLMLVSLSGQPISPRAACQ